MRKNKYIMPSIEIAEMDAEELLQDAMSGGGNDSGHGTTESKRTIFASFELEDSNDDWGNIWADETEQY